MSFFCPICNTENGAGNVWKGMNIRCPACLREITLIALMGPNKASSASEDRTSTFTEFCYMLEDTTGMKKAKRVIEKLLDCSVETFDGRFVLIRKGALIPLEVAHIIIQFDPSKQMTFYNLRMELYR